MDCNACDLECRWRRRKLSRAQSARTAWQETNTGARVLPRLVQQTTTSYELFQFLHSASNFCGRAVGNHFLNRPARDVALAYQRISRGRAAYCGRPCDLSRREPKD